MSPEGYVALKVDGLARADHLEFGALFSQGICRCRVV